MPLRCRHRRSLSATLPPKTARVQSAARYERRCANLVSPAPAARGAVETLVFRRSADAHAAWRRCCCCCQRGVAARRLRWLFYATRHRHAIDFNFRRCRLFSISSSLLFFVFILIVADESFFCHFSFSQLMSHICRRRFQLRHSPADYRPIYASEERDTPSLPFRFTLPISHFREPPRESSARRGSAGRRSPEPPIIA